MSFVHLRSASRVAAVHGRFQPFHNGHLEYAMRAYELCDLLYIGITNSEPGHVGADKAAPHRHLTEANPYPFFIRTEMVLGAMQAAGADYRRIRIVPFPINRPELISCYVPPNATHYLCVFDDWGRRKLEVLKSVGIHAIGWTDMPKRAMGTAVRQQLADGTEVSESVPAFVQEYLTGAPA